MNALLHDMITLTRLDEKASEYKFEELNVASVLRKVLNDVSLSAQEKNIRIVADIPEQMKIQGEASLLYSVFRNILDNAIAYSGADTISIGTETINTHYIFTITDNGVGVAAEHLPHLFERFYRVDNGRSRELGGTGLGLAIVKNAVLLHGGKINAYSATPHGLCIQFSLSIKGHLSLASE